MFKLRRHQVDDRGNTRLYIVRTPSTTVAVRNLALHPLHTLRILFRPELFELQLQRARLREGWHRLREDAEFIWGDKAVRSILTFFAAMTLFGVALLIRLVLRWTP